MYGSFSRARVSISINGAAAVDADSFFAIEATVAGARGKFKSFSSDGNSICMKYQAGTHSNRWLFVIRLGPPNTTYS
jgi:hypothetical protein